jgi:hypothetical protein
MLWHSSVVVFLSNLYQLPPPAPRTSFSLQLFAEIVRKVYIEPVPESTDRLCLWGFRWVRGKWSLLPKPPLRVSSDVQIRMRFTIDIGI